MISIFLHSTLLDLQIQFCCNVTSIEIWSLEYSNKSSQIRVSDKIFEKKLNLSSDIWTELENNSPSFQLSSCSDRSQPTIGWIVPHNKSTTCRYFTGQSILLTAADLVLPRWYIICYKFENRCSICRLSILCGNEYSHLCYEEYLSGSSSLATNQSLNYWVMQGVNFPFSSISTLDINVKLNRKIVASQKDVKLKPGQKQTFTFDGLLPRRLYTIERCVNLQLPASIYLHPALTSSFSTQRQSICRIAHKKTCEPHNPSFKICCNGVLQNKGINNECCGTEAYDSTFKICCYGVVQNRGLNKECCGTEPFNPEMKMCCKGHLHYRRLNKECCGTEPFNPEMKMCCKGQLHYRGLNKACCGREPFNPDFKMCCNEKLYTRKPGYVC